MTKRRSAQGEETRRRLVLGAFELVSEEGFPGLTAGKLSKVVGISKSTIFHHFASINDLAIEAMRSWFDGAMTPLENEHKEHSNIKDYLEALGETMLCLHENTKQYRATMAFFHKALCDEVFRKTFSSFLSGYMERERIIFAELTGMDREDKTLGDWAALTAATLDGLSMQLAITQDLPQCQAAWKQYSNLLVAALDPLSKQGVNNEFK